MVEVSEKKRDTHRPCIEIKGSPVGGKYHLAT